VLVDDRRRRHALRGSYAIPSWRLIRDTSTDTPQSACDLERINSTGFPPFEFIAELMVLAVVHPAQWHHEFVAVLASQRASLSKTKMVSIGRRAPAYQTRLQRDKSQVDFIAMAANLRKIERALVDLYDAGCI